LARTPFFAGVDLLGHPLDSFSRSILLEPLAVTNSVSSVTVTMTSLSGPSHERQLLRLDVDLGDHAKSSSRLPGDNDGQGHEATASVLRNVRGPFIYLPP